MQIPIRGAFVSAESGKKREIIVELSREITESVPDSAPNYYDSRHRSTSPLYSSKSQRLVMSESCTREVLQYLRFFNLLYF